MRESIITFINRDLLNGRSLVHEEEELLLSGTIDSLGVMRLVAHIEQECDVRIPPQDITIENFSTVQSIASYIRDQLGAN